MRRKGEKGEGKLGGLIFLALVAALALAAWNVAPAYIQYYDFKDKVNEICRTPRYKARTDERIVEMLMREVTERRMTRWVGPESFTISTNDRGRRIELYYERDVQVLPGLKKQTFKFRYTAEQPLI